MADTSVKSTVDIEVGVTGTGSIKSIKTELKEAKADAIAMARAFGENSKEANLAASKVAKLTDEVEDLGLKVKALNPDKFQRLATLGQGIASGFAAATGAVALFGTESEELNKTMIKLQSAIAISQGVQGFMDFLKSASPLMIALSIAITVVIVAWEKLTDVINASEIAEKKALKTSIDASEKRLAIAKSLGEETFEIERQLLRDRINLLVANNAKEEEISKAKTDLIVFENEQLVKGLDKEHKAITDAALLKEKIEDANEERAKARRIKAQQDWKEAQDKAQKQIIDDANWNDAIDKKKAEDRAVWVKAQNDLAIEEEKRVGAEVAKLQVQEEARVKEQQERLVAYEKLKYDLVKGGLQALSDLTYLFAGKSEEAQKRAFNIQKALSIAQTIISTIESAQAAFKAGQANPVANLVPGGGFALGVAQATIATAAGLAKVKQIQQTQFNSTNVPTSSGGGVSAPSIAPTTEQQRQVIGNSTGASNIIKQSDVKVYVTETDISKSINRVGDIRRRAIIK